MRYLFILLFFIQISTPLFASEINQLGKELFNSTKLGSNNRTCNQCHQNAKGLAHIDEYDSVMLREIINFCIRDALKGEMLPMESEQMLALESYIKGLQKKSTTTK